MWPQMLEAGNGHLPYLQTFLIINQLIVLYPG